MTRPAMAIAAWLMLAMWMPATLHCAVEEAGFLNCVWDCHAEVAGAGHEDSDCARDMCKLVEDGDYGFIRGQEVIPVFPPAAWLLSFVELPLDDVSGLCVSRTATGRPDFLAEDWAVLWRCVERVAPPVRAPAEGQV